MDARAATLALGGVWFGRRGIARCPVAGHGRGRGDVNPSLSIGVSDSGQTLVHCFAGCSQNEVIRALKARGLWGGKAGVARTRPATCAQDAGKARSELAERIWRSGRPVRDTPAEVYLHGRGLAARSDELRFSSALRHPRGGARHAGFIAALRGAGGELVGLQRTYLTADGEKPDLNPVRAVLGAIGDASVQLMPAQSKLGLAEGIETALAAAELFAMPVWAACGARLQAVDLPDIVKRVAIFADNDAPGLETAMRAKARFEAEGRKVEVRKPDLPGADWNDVLIGEGAVGDER